VQGTWPIQYTGRSRVRPLPQRSIETTKLFTFATVVDVTWRPSTLTREIVWFFGRVQRAVAVPAGGSPQSPKL
jgi:hypothetical protein